MAVHVKVTGHQQIAEYIKALPQALVYAFDDYAKSQAPYWEEILKETVAHVVYDAYQPREYKRTLGLIDAVASEVSVVPAHSVRAVLFDDPAKVTLRGGDVSAGGTPKDEVLFEIEEGQYPQPWYGPTGPRPAYRIFADSIRPIVYADADAIVARVIL